MGGWRGVLVASSVPNHRLYRPGLSLPARAPVAGSKSRISGASRASGLRQQPAAVGYRLCTPPPGGNCRRNRPIRRSLSRTAVCVEAPPYRQARLPQRGGRGRHRVAIRYARRQAPAVGGPFGPESARANSAARHSGDTFRSASGWRILIPPPPPTCAPKIDAVRTRFRTEGGEKYAE